MLLFQLIIIPFLLLSSLKAYDNYKCRTADTQKQVEKDDEVFLCIHIPNLKKKTIFKLKVDEYSVMSINNGFSNIVKTKEKPKEDTKDTDKPEEGTKLRNLFLNQMPEEEKGNSTDENEIREEFIAQIGNVTTKFPAVINIFLIFVLYRYIIGKMKKMIMVKSLLYLT